MSPAASESVLAHALPFVRRLRILFIPKRLTTLAIPLGVDPSLIQQCEQLLTALMRIGIVLGGLLVALAARGMLRQGRVAQLLIVLFFLGLVALVSLRRQVDYRLRCGLWLFSLYGLAITELLYLGFASATQVYLACFTLGTAIFLSYNPHLSLGALALSVATLMIANALAFAGYFVPLAGPPLATTMPQIFIRSLTFLAMVGTCQAGIGILLHQLRVAWQREHAARAQLELRVAERTSELAAAHAQLLAHSHEQAEQQGYLTALHQTTIDLLGERDIGTLLRAIVERSSLITHAPWVVLVLEEQGELIVKTFTPGHTLIEGMPVPRDQAYLTWRCFETHKPVLVDDYMAIEPRLHNYDALHPGAVANVPIMAGPRCLGVLALMRVRQHPPFSPAEIEQATTFARLVALVLDNTNLVATAQRELAERTQAELALQRHADALAAANAQLLLHSQQQAKQQEFLTALYQTTVDLLSHRELMHLLQAIVERAASILEAPYALITLDRSGELITLALTPGLPTPPGSRAERGVAIFTWQCYETHQPALVDNYRDRADRNPKLDHLDIYSIAHLPILAGARCLGVLALSRTQSGHSFSALEIERAMAFAQLVAVVIENARLYDAAQHELAERERAEAALQRYTNQLESHNSELDAFAHTVAHDLKNPLTSLIGYAELLDHNYALFDEPQVQSFLRDITRMGYKMSHIINDLLLFANVRVQSSMPMNVLAMDAILLDVELRLQVLIQRSQALLVLPGQWPAALGYAPWVEEVWMNYISNALKYGGDPPRVTLGATDLGNGSIYFWVDDNGPGLVAEERAQLFAPFTRLHGAHAEGHGLGLSIVQRIVERLGGAVGVEAAPGGGSRFFFTLPAAPG